MANGDLHTIRFKREGVEFELTATQEEVARAWETLQTSVVAAFEGGAEVESNGEQNGDGDGEGKSKRKRVRRSTTKKRDTGTEERADVAKKLAETPLDGFAKIGNKPSARFAGFAALDWARQKADIDGLTSQEIQKFLSSRLRIKNTYQAYAAALGGRVKAGEIDKVGNLFKIMGAGEDSLAEHVKEVADKND